MKSWIGLLSVVAVMGVIAGCGGTGGTTIQPSGLIVFSDSETGNRNITINNVNTGTLLGLDRTAEAEYGAVLSHDGSRVAYLAERGGQVDIYTINPNGTGITRVTNTPEQELGLAFSADGTKIYYVRGDAAASEMRVINVNGTGDALVPGVAASPRSPSISPNGRWLAYWRPAGGTSSEYRIHDLTTGADTPLLTDTPFVASISWETNDSLFISRRDGGTASSVFSIRRDGTNLTRVVENGWGALISPDGGRVMFRRLVGGVVQAVNVLRNGTDLRPYTNSPGDVTALDWR
ncbi:MAG: hypothetical protein MH204_11380 [Fimbriimonadaceae bacterium]|nr:hypothetical protein [Fimbriimonadaceae bacterium]